MFQPFKTAAIATALACASTSVPAEAGLIAFGAASGGPIVETIDASTLTPTAFFFAFDPEATGGARVALGDVNGDDAVDLVIGSGPQSLAVVKQFNAPSNILARSFLAYDPGFQGGVNVATGDFDGDGKADIVTGASAGGGPHVKLFNGATGAQTHSFFAFEPQFSGGVRVAAGDAGGDGRMDIIVGTETQGARVRVFDGQSLKLLADFLPFGRTAAGMSLAVGRFCGVNALFVGTGVGGPSSVNIYSLADFKKIASTQVFASSFIGGVNVAATSSGGRDALVVSAASAGGDVVVLDTCSRNLSTVLASFRPFGSGFQRGITVSASPAPTVRKYPGSVLQR